MAIIVNSPLVIPSEYVEGVQSGRIERFGGVLRDAMTKRIIAHLKEVSQSARESEGVANPLLGEISKALGSATKGQGIAGANMAPQMLSSVLQLSQIGAAASVLNLGVSVAGFAYMGYKLHQLQKSMSAMQESMDAGFDRVEAKLDAIAEQLRYLVLLAKENKTAQREIRESLAELHRAILIAELAELKSWLDQLARFPDDSPKDAMRAASRVRHTLSDQAVRAAPQFETRVMVIADVAIRGWAVATVTEANLLMELGEHREARQLIEHESPRFAQLTEKWTDALLADGGPELRTAYRFEAPRFQPYVLPERIGRIAQYHALDRDLTDDRKRRVSEEASLELEMSHNASLDEQWLHKQLAVAEYLDGLGELSNRIHSVGEFAEECELRQLPSSRAILPSADSEPGYYVLPAISREG